MQDWWLETVIRGVAGPRFSMSSYSTSLLYTVRWFMYSGKRSQSQTVGYFHLSKASYCARKVPVIFPIPKPPARPEACEQTLPWPLATH